MEVNSLYNKSKEAGYSDEEIIDFLSKDKRYSDKVKKSKDAGYSNEDILKFISQSASSSKSSLEEPKKEKSKLEKAGRLAAQFGTGLIQSRGPVLAYDIAALPVNTEGYAYQERMEDLISDFEYLETRRQFDKDWSEKDQKEYDYLKDRILNPGKNLEDLNTGRFDISSQGLLEKATGLDLHPEGISENAARWIGFLKDPKKFIPELKRIGTNPSEIVKSLTPGTKSLRAFGAGAALDLAEDGQFGPVGTIAAAIIGDIAGHGPQAIKNAVLNPKETLAKATNFFTRANNQKVWIDQLTRDANEMGIQLDAGTLTGSNLVKMLQARAAQSSLTGEALDNFRKDLSQQVLSKYKEIADQIGDSRFESTHQASEAIKDTLKQEEKANPFFKDQNKPARSLEGRVDVQDVPPYEQEFLDRIAQQEFTNDYVAGETLKTAAADIKEPIKEEFSQRWNQFEEQITGIEGPQAQLAGDLERFIGQNEGSLLLGESTAEARVLNSAQQLLDLIRPEGGYTSVTLSNLIKTKRTLADVADYEFGGSNFQSRYKSLVQDIDNAIDRTLERFSPELRQEFDALNAEYSAFKDAFENKNVLPLFEPKNQNYNAIYNSFVSNADNLRSLEDIFYLTDRGNELIDQVKRDFAQRVLSKRNLSERELRNLAQVLGPEFTEELGQYLQQRRNYLENPPPRARLGRPLGVDVPIETGSGKPLSGRVKEADTQVRKKMYDFLKDKSSEQVMRMMDTIDGINKLEKALSTTDQGRQLFKDLSRYKLEEMISNKMKNELSDQIKMGTFSNLLKTKESRAIVKRLMGDKAYNQLRKLQSIAGKLEASASKFLNVSQSGTSLADVGTVATFITGVVTGNPFMAFSALGGVISMRVAANLLADPVFLKHLEKAATAKNKTVFINNLKIMEPIVDKAIKAQQTQSQ